MEPKNCTETKDDFRKDTDEQNRAILLKSTITKLTETHRTLLIGTGVYAGNAARNTPAVVLDWREWSTPGEYMSLLVRKRIELGPTRNMLNTTRGTPHTST
jgi:hypothetical protein